MAKFEIGEKVQIKVSPSNNPALFLKEHNGEIVTIREYNPFYKAYMVEEYPADIIGPYTIPSYIGEGALKALEK
jgi:ribosomal protein L21E